VKQLNCKLYYQQLHFKYLCNLPSYWLQARWVWHDSVETCRSVIIREIIVYLLVTVQNKKKIDTTVYYWSWSPSSYGTQGLQGRAVRWKKHGIVEWQCITCHVAHLEFSRGYIHYLYFLLFSFSFFCNKIRRVASSWKHHFKVGADQGTKTRHSDGPRATAAFERNGSLKTRHFQ
jgi:hypothetical protein